MSLAPHGLGLKIFRSDSCVSYVLFHAQSRVALLIDPHVGVLGDYQTFLADQRLQLLAIIETQTHLDHYSASHHFLRATNQAELIMASRTQSLRATRKVSGRERIQLGPVGIEIVETPGV